VLGLGLRHTAQRACRMPHSMRYDQLMLSTLPPAAGAADPLRLRLRDQAACVLLLSLLLASVWVP
jgi:hypothetical protein